jgi:3-(3-hydroxy-phenyl)propionate hydroxylase
VGEVSEGLDTRPVVVVGAGPTGSCVALGLAARGVRCVVVDRWEQVYEQPRAVHLDDEVYRSLARLGLGDDLARITRPAAGLRLVDARLRVLAEFSRAGLSPANGRPRANMFDQPVLDGVLRERLLAHERITFIGGREVEGVDQDASGVRVHVRDVRSGAVEEVEGSYVLGCDGANSRVRSWIGSSMVDLGFEQRWLVLDVESERDLGQWDGVQQVCDSRRAATYMRVGETRHRWEVRLLDDEDAADLTSLDDVRPLLARWLGEGPLDDVRLVRATGYTFRAAVADRWRSGRVLLLGDAAHVTPPFIGQGLGAGVRDAANLAWKLAGVLQGTLAPSALDTYETERRPHATAMVLLARRLGVVMCSGGPAGDVVRRAVAPLLSRSRLVAGAALDGTTPRLSAGDLVAPHRGDPLAGRLCPDVVDGVPGLDARLDGRWALVTRVAPSPSCVDVLQARDAAVVRAQRDELDRWLASAGRDAALVRPDGTVAASGAVTDLVSWASATLAPAAQPAAA